MDHIIWRIDNVDSIDSTNAWLAAETRRGAPEGRGVLARFQSAGRGRLDRTWEAPPDSALLLSVLLRPSSVRGALWAVSAMALATRAALVRLCGLRPTLKWPNDLLVAEEKVGGVLGELVVSDPPAVVVGIGLNLTAHPSDVPATSVRRATGVTISSAALADIVLEELEARRAHLDSDAGLAVLRQEYLTGSATIGQRVRVELVDDPVVGLAVDVDLDGALVLEVDGARRVVTAADVVHLRHDDRGAR